MSYVVKVIIEKSRGEVSLMGQDTGPFKVNHKMAFSGLGNFGFDSNPGKIMGLNYVDFFVGLNPHIYSGFKPEIHFIAQ
jgi:hypothetical protein